MLVVRTVEGRANVLGQLLGAEQPIGFHHPLRLPCTHLGSIGFSHGLCLGSRQLMILTPRPLFLTPRLCVPIQLRSSLLTCQGALSQIKTKTFLPIP